MSAIVDAFTLKPYDLESVYGSWLAPPRFNGDPKKDMLVDEWLKQIKTGCLEKKVPKEFWHKVGIHYMGGKAKTRFDELKTVMAKVHGGKYRWNWKKFKIAMRNMGWAIDTSQTETLKVHASKRPGGLWWITRKNDESVLERGITPTTPTHSVPSSKTSQESSQSTPSSSFWLTRKIVGEPDEEKWEKIGKTADVKESGEINGDGKRTMTRRMSDIVPKPKRRQTTMSVETVVPAVVEPKRPEMRQKSRSDSIMQLFDWSTKDLPSIPAEAAESDAVDTISAQAPVWLVNVCSALDFLNDEHPKVMTTLGAILITVGSIPAIPAVHAGAAGALLASTAVQAAGTIAVSVGAWIQGAQAKKETSPEPSSVSKPEAKPVAAVGNGEAKKKA